MGEGVGTLAGYGSISRSRNVASFSRRSGAILSVKGGLSIGWWPISSGRIGGSSRAEDDFYSSRSESRSCRGADGRRTLVDAPGRCAETWHAESRMSSFRSVRARIGLWSREYQISNPVLHRSCAGCRVQRSTAGLQPAPGVEDAETRRGDRTGTGVRRPTGSDVSAGAGSVHVHASEGSPRGITAGSGGAP